ncbi:L-gulonolactone oxidase-like [Rhopilema esculentum]|uniref:L-gulonolactone oxidase-like n=1 Tax=Rhopilema esculentum TaxID=499914 RepID=UPI0031CE6D6E|eukprot:gene12921-3676_t
MALQGISNYRFTNWAKTYSCQPELFFEPETVEELAQILRQASAERKRVRVIGFGHSPSDICCTNDFMIRLFKFNKVLHLDKNENTIKIGAGMMLRDLNTILENNGMAMCNLPAIDDITIGGIIATGTHGSGMNFGIISTLVRDLELMKADGEIIYCSRQSNPEIFKAALLSLGCVGIVTSVTLQCEPAFRLHETAESAPVEETLATFEDDLKKSEHFKFLYHPHTGNCVKYHIKRSDKPVVDPGESWFWDSFVGFHMLQFLLYIASFFPRLVNVINRFYHSMFFRNPTERCNAPHKILHFNCLFPQYVSEWSFPREKTGYVLRSLRDAISKENLHVHLPVEIRFGKADDIYLSPCYKRDVTFMNILMFRPYYKDVPGKERYWAIYESIVKSIGGRPHWAKAHKVVPDELREMYPEFGKFLEIRKSLDPNGMFLNEYLERHILGTTSVQI